MKKLTDLPIYDPDPAASFEKARDRAIAEGREARRAGLRLSRCPPFIDPDMR